MIYHSLYHGSPKKMHSWNSVETQLSFDQLKLNWFCRNSWISTIEICFQLLFNSHSTVECMQIDRPRRWSWKQALQQELNASWKLSFLRNYPSWTQVENWDCNLSPWPAPCRFMPCLGHLSQTVLAHTFNLWNPTFAQVPMWHYLCI